MQQGRILLGFGVEPAAGVGQVGTIESGDVHLRSAQPEHANDVVANIRRGRRGQGDRGGRAHLFAHLAQAHVFRAEVVSPEAQAVSFVHHQQVRTKLRPEALERRRREALGREIEETSEILLELCQYLRLLARRLRAVQQQHGHTQHAQLLDLVGHERDQRRDYDGQALQQQGRKLEAEAFARAGRHDADDIVAREHVLRRSPADADGTPKAEKLAATDRRDCPFWWPVPTVNVVPGNLW